MTQLRLVPWSHLKSWVCDACGECCRWFSVPVRMHEYAVILQRYGCGVVGLGLGRAYLRKRHDSRCIFQLRLGDRWLCGLQAKKPRVCKMWPFVVSKDPEYGRDEAARWEGSYGRAYVYVDPRCPRAVFGKPTRYLVEKVLPELVDLAFGRRESQLYTTHISDSPFGYERKAQSASQALGPSSTTYEAD